MSTRVIDFELSDRPDAIEHLGSHYSDALLLLRWKGVPVGRATIPIRFGRIDSAALEKGLASSLGRDFWAQWLRDSLDWNPRPGASAADVSRTTVAICTRERPDDLSRALSAIARLSPAPGETLVVDNRPSTRATADVVRNFPFARYTRQDEGGLNAARNRALAEASGHIVAFTDDDAVPDQRWLGALVGGFAEPSVMAVTGLTMPLELETPAQEAFELHSPFCRGFAHRTFESRLMNPLTAGLAGAGANMALRRDVVARVGQFDEALDAGTPTRSGGDHEYFARILSAGYWIIYEPSALNWHRHRRSWRELRETLFGYGTGIYALFTRALLEEGEVSALKFALRWFVRGQFPAFVRSVLRRPGRVPLDLLLAEYAGCLRGPSAYLRARRQVRQRHATPRRDERRVPVTTP